MNKITIDGGWVFMFFAESYGTFYCNFGNTTPFERKKERGGKGRGLMSRYKNTNAHIHTHMKQRHKKSFSVQDVPYY